MPVFVYRAGARRGQTIDGVMEAPDARAVVERLQRDSYFPIRVAPHADRQSWLSLGGSGRISQGDVLAFTQQLATLFESTLPLDRSLAILEELAPNALVQAIPLPTQILLTVSAIFSSYWWVGVLLVFAAMLAWRMWTGSPQGRLQWDQTLLGIPLIGPLVMKIETARFARTLGTMLKSGVPVMSALAVVGDTMTNQSIGQAVARLSDGVKRGGTIAAGMQEQAPFPVLAMHMVRAGEETGRLEDMVIEV